MLGLGFLGTEGRAEAVGDFVWSVISRLVSKMARIRLSPSKPKRNGIMPASANQFASVVDPFKNISEENPTQPVTIRIARNTGLIVNDEFILASSIG